MLTGARLNRFWVDAIRRLPFGRVKAFLAYESLVRGFTSYRNAETYFGSRLVCDPSDAVQRRILFFGVWEPSISLLIEQTLENGDCFIDVGANIGYDTLLGSHCVGDKGSVVSIEASPRTAELLRANVRANDAANVEIIAKAVSNESNQISMFSGDAGNIGSASADQSRGGALEAVVDAAPLDVLIGASTAARARLVKMDIEGFELPVLQDIISKIDAYSERLEIIFELTAKDDADQWNALLGRFRQAGFRTFLIDNAYVERPYIDPPRDVALTEFGAVPDRPLLDVFLTRDGQKWPKTLGFRSPSASA